ncbi:MAG: hypothetical protein HRT54_04000 [Colwellia sp.]|nr:hypothetical protein [Colwellia sp.]
MSNKHADNNGKQTQTSALPQQSDEDFINELYNEVSEVNQSQPSDILDQRIISAAHKAVNKTNKQKENNNLKWYSSLATAASLTLVISLVVLQQSNILPNEQANEKLKNGIALQKTMAPISNNDAFVEQEVVAEQIDYQAPASYSTIPSQMANSIANKTKVATKETMVRAMQYEQKTQLTEQKTAKRMIASPPVIMQNFKRTEQAKAQEDKVEIMNLSIKQLEQYQRSNKTLDSKSQWLWSFSSENDIEYIIDIFQEKKKPLQYRLDKSLFNIVGTSPVATKEIQLKNNELSKITISLTHN